ncbi:MAG: sulfatase [Planctomycetaceae bacterium]|nr:sulfatase [Planctomycetaceae bacterium]
MRLFLAAILLTLLPAFARAETNILILMADNWAWPHASVYEKAIVKTPTFDRIAREGVLFQHAFCSVPSCAPARAVFLSGQAAHRLEGGANLWGVFPAKFPVYTDHLAKAGYRCGFSGKGWAPGSIEESGRSQNPAGEKFKSFAEFLAQRGEDKGPFCFWFSSREPHAPWTVNEEKLDQISQDKIRIPDHLPDHPDVREDIARYYLEVQAFDQQCAEHLDLLEQAGLAENTLVMIVGDNGWQLPRGLAHCYDWGTRVPMAILWPGVTKPGHVVEEFLSFEDVAPTFLELAGLETPAEMTGTSFVSLLRGASDRARDHVFLEKERHANVRRGDLTYPCRCIRTENFLYVWNLHPERWPSGDPELYWAVGPYGDVDWSRTKDLLTAEPLPDTLQRFYDLGFDKRPQEELYDLRIDPDQARNVANDPKYEETLASLRERVKTWMRNTDDPRAKGETDLYDRAPYFGRKKDPAELKR